MHKQQLKDKPNGFFHLNVALNRMYGMHKLGLDSSFGLNKNDGLDSVQELNTVQGLNTRKGLIRLCSLNGSLDCNWSENFKINGICDDGAYKEVFVSEVYERKGRPPT
jgi:hypothetical protein